MVWRHRCFGIGPKTFEYLQEASLAYVCMAVLAVSPVLRPVILAELQSDLQIFYQTPLAESRVSRLDRVDALGSAVIAKLFLPEIEDLLLPDPSTVLQKDLSSMTRSLWEEIVDAGISRGGRYGEGLNSCFEVIVKDKYALPVEDLGKQKSGHSTPLYTQIILLDDKGSTC